MYCIHTVLYSSKCKYLVSLARVLQRCTFASAYSHNFLVSTRQAVLFWSFLRTEMSPFGSLTPTLRAVNEGHGHARYDAHELSFRR
jgi:hypothetical protein